MNYALIAPVAKSSEQAVAKQAPSTKKSIKGTGSVSKTTNAMLIKHLPDKVQESNAPAAEEAATNNKEKPNHTVHGTKTDRSRRHEGSGS